MDLNQIENELVVQIPGQPVGHQVGAPHPTQSRVSSSQLHSGNLQQ